MKGIKRGLGTCALGTVLLSALLAGMASDARAWATITVNSLADPGAPGICALRDAITAANTMSATNGCMAGRGNDTIWFSVTGMILLASTLPEVTDTQLTIEGPITIDGDNNVQVMQVASGTTLNLKNLTIAHGFGFFSGNIAGGGISNEGTLTITNSTFSGNSAGAGGGIMDLSATLTITNSSFFGNSVATNGFGAGGGIFNNPFLNFATASLKSTILADSSSGGNCGGTITDAGYNISDDATCGFAETGSANNGDGVDPLLSSAGLADNGGPTQTIALLNGSPAIDAIPLADCTDQASPPNRLTTDQRGFPRPDAGEQVCDIGAYEFQDFAGQPGAANCQGVSASALAHQFGSIKAAASALRFPSVQVLQKAIRAFCRG